MDELERLTAHEALVLAGLLRKLIGADGVFSEAERHALTRASQLIAVVDEAALATDAEAPALGTKELYALIEQAGETYADDTVLRKAALEIERVDARAAIYAILFDVAASDMVSEREGELLDWLSDEWELDTHTALPGEATDVGADVT
jgi:uncharacterized tellurite resistance protein B-like protein